ncbi:class I SAM-dependent methyltransferase [Candidatus Woesearchaeota archaeon]|nr:class I SAM-dependent methyltransferase [Candidatus Woesearchaeota archaeon]
MTSASRTARARIKPRITDAAYIQCRSAFATFNILKPLFKRKIRILDVGCGDKIYESIFPKAEYLGVDNDPNSKADIVCDASKLPYKNGAFDLVICSEVLEHVYNPDKVISELLRVCKKGGQIYLSSPFIYPLHDYTHDFYRYTELFYRKRFKKYHVTALRPSNSFFSTPFLLTNILFSNKDNILFIPLYLCLNLVALFVDALGKALVGMASIFRKKKEATHILNSAPLDFSIIIKK